MMVKLQRWVDLIPKFSWFVQVPCSMKAFGERLFFPVSVYNSSYHKFGFETEPPNLREKRQPLPTPKTHPRATRSPAGSLALGICQQGLGHAALSWKHHDMAEGNKTKITCFSSSQMVSSDTLLLNFLTWLTLLLRTFLRASLDLLVDCLASLARLSLCSLVTLEVRGKEKHQKQTVSCVAHPDLLSAMDLG